MKNKKIKLKKIKIPASFITKPPKAKKMKEKLYMWYTGGFTNLPPIIIDSNYNLLDGYCTYLITRVVGGKNIRCCIKKNIVKKVKHSYSPRKIQRRINVINNSDTISEQLLSNIENDRYCIRYNDLNVYVQHYVSLMKLIIHSHKEEYPFSINIVESNDKYIDVEFSVGDMVFLQDYVSIILLKDVGFIKQNLLLTEYISYTSLVSDINAISEIINAVISIKKIS